MSILEKLQKELDNRDNDTEIVSEDVTAEESLMSPPQVGQEKSGQSGTEELLRQLLKIQQETSAKLEETLLKKLNDFKTETNAKLELLCDASSDSESDNEQHSPCKKRKLDKVEEKKGDRTDCRPESAKQVGQTGGSPSTSSVSEKTADSNEFYSKLSEKFVESEKTGPKVDGKLSDIIKEILKGNLSDKRRSELLDKHLRPENCAQLVVPRVNKEIWSIMFQSKQKDISWQKLQKTLITAVVPVINAVGKLVAAEKEKERVNTDDIVTDLMDAVVLMANVSQEISYKRRDSIKQDLGDKYTELCSRQTPITDYLFGNEVDEEMKRIDKTKSLGKNLSGNDKNDKSFLGGGFRKFFPKWKRGRNSWKRKNSRNNRSTRENRDNNRH